MWPKFAFSLGRVVPQLARVDRRAGVAFIVLLEPIVFQQALPRPLPQAGGEITETSPQRRLHQPAGLAHIKLAAVPCFEFSDHFAHVFHALGA